MGSHKWFTTSINVTTNESPQWICLTKVTKIMNYFQSTMTAKYSLVSVPTGYHLDYLEHSTIHFRICHSSHTVYFSIPFASFLHRAIEILLELVILCLFLQRLILLYHMYLLLAKLLQGNPIWSCIGSLVRLHSEYCTLVIYIPAWSGTSRYTISSCVRIVPDICAFSDVVAEEYMLTFTWMTRWGTPITNAVTHDLCLYSKFEKIISLHAW